MKHRDIQLLKKIISECRDIIRYANEVGEKGFLENDVYQKAAAMSLLNIGEHAKINRKAGKINGLHTLESKVFFIY